MTLNLGKQSRLKILGTKRNPILPSLHIQDKGTFVLTFFVKLKENTLINCILKRFLTITFSGKLLNLFSEKGHTTESITLVESNQIIDKDDRIFYSFFFFFFLFLFVFFFPFLYFSVKSQAVTYARNSNSPCRNLWWRF